MDVTHVNDSEPVSNAYRAARVPFRARGGITAHMLLVNLLAALLAVS